MYRHLHTLYIDMYDSRVAGVFEDATCIINTPSKEIGYNMTRCIHFKWIFIDLFYHLFLETLYLY